jgi:hypothetical protein
MVHATRKIGLGINKLITLGTTTQHKISDRKTATWPAAAYGGSKAAAAARIYILWAVAVERPQMTMEFPYICYINGSSSLTR